MTQPQYTSILTSPQIVEYSRYLRKWFKVLTSVKTQGKKTWLSWHDYADAAIECLVMLHWLPFDKKIEFSTKYIPKRATVGFSNNSITDTLFHFKSLSSMYDWYKYKFSLKTEKLNLVYYKNHQNIEMLQRVYKLDKEDIINLSIVILYLIIEECGPDHDWFHSIFSNILYNTSANHDYHEWVSIRTKVFGSKGGVNVQSEEDIYEDMKQYFEDIEKMPVAVYYKPKIKSYKFSMKMKTPINNFLSHMKVSNIDIKKMDKTFFEYYDTEEWNFCSLR